MNEMQHPIENLMRTTMENMKEMIDVNTIVGDPVQTNSGQVIIPISKVTFGFASGGGEYTKINKRDKMEEHKEAYPFAGGSGAGITVQPVAFMVVGQDDTRLLSVDQNANMVDNILAMTPKIMENMNSIFGKGDKTTTGTSGINTDTDNTMH